MCIVNPLHLSRSRKGFSSSGERLTRSTLREDVNEVVFSELWHLEGL